VKFDADCIERLWFAIYGGGHSGSRLGFVDQDAGLLGPRHGRPDEQLRS
jgi:hypothetical protein